LLPYNNHEKRSISFQLAPIGGSGNYQWSVENGSILSISPKGLIKGLKEGSTTVTLTDVSNPKNEDIIEVEVRPIFDTFFIEKLKEIRVGQKATVHYYSVDANKRRFTACSEITYSSKAESSKYFQAKIPYLPEDEKTYEELEALRTKYPLFARVLTEDGKYGEYERAAGLYRNYISSSEVTEKELKKLLSNYKTFGVCGKVEVEGLVSGEAKHWIGPIDSSLGEQRLRVLAEMNTAHPSTSEEFLVGGDYLVAFGSNLKWTVVGGPYAWSALEPVETFRVGNENHSESDGMSTKRLESDSPTSFKSELTCSSKIYAEEKKFSIALSRAHEPSLDLLFPLKFSTSIIVTCGLPKFFEWFEITETSPSFGYKNFRKDYFKSPSLTNDKTYTLQNWAFSKSHKPYYSYDSMVLTWESSDEKLARFEDPNLNGQTMKLVLNDLSGTVELVAKSTALKDRTYFNEVSKKVSISVLNSLSVEPRSKLVFNSPAAQFRVSILKGSGNFKISLSDPTVAQAVLSYDNKYVTITPLKIGDTRLRVEDTQVLHSSVGICDIYVRTPEIVTLKLEENYMSTSNLNKATLTVTDSEGKEFDASIINLMKITIAPESRSAADISALEFKKGQGNEVDIRGKQAGEFVLSATLSLDGREIHSNLEPLDVFIDLRTNPLRIVNSVGCMTSVQLLDGPTQKLFQKHSMVFKALVSEPSIASVAKEDFKTFQINSLQNGMTTIFFRIESAKGKSIAQTSLLITVGDITDFRVLNMNGRKIHVDAPVRMIALGMVGEMLMTPSFCDFQYKWTSKNTELITIGNVHKSSDPTGLQGVDFMAVNVIGKAEGQVELLVEINLKTSLGDHRVYKASAKVNIIQAISIPTPTYVYNQMQRNNHIILPPNSVYRIQANIPNYNLNFKLLWTSDSAIVKTDPRGELIVNGERGEGTVLVTDRTNTDQFSYLNLRVVDIFSIFIEDASKAEVLPLGSTTALQIQLQNENGFLFPQPLEGVRLQAMSTHLGVVSLAFDEFHSKLLITANSSGFAYVIVYLESNPAVFDILRVEVGSMVTPAGLVKVHKGGKIRFTANVAKLGSDEIKWDTDNLKVLTVDANNGLVTAIGNGTANVSLRNLPQYKTLVRTIEIDELELVTEQSRRITNNPQSGYYKQEYELEFEASSQGERITGFSTEADTVNNNLSFRCESPQAAWVKIEASVENNKNNNGQKLSCVLSVNPSYVDQNIFPDHITVIAVLQSSDPSVGFTLRKEFIFSFDWGFSYGSLPKVVLP
jgi:hypothetical protein